MKRQQVRRSLDMRGKASRLARGLARIASRRDSQRMAPSFKWNPAEEQGRPAEQYHCPRSAPPKAPGLSGLQAGP